MKAHLALAAIPVFAAAMLVSQPAPRVTPGPQADDSTMLVSGWKITPAGKQIPVDTLPMSTALSPDGKYLLVLNGGYNPPSISVIDTVTTVELERTRVPDAWLGLVITAKGDTVYVGGGSTGSVYEFSFSAGKLLPARTLSTLTKAPEGTPAEQTYRNFTGDVALSPDGRFLYAANVFQDSLVVLNRESGKPVARVRTGRRPYRIAFLPDGKTYLVTNWADGTLSQFQASDNSPMATLRLGAHPTDMLLRAGANVSQDSGHTWLGRLFVAAANTNSVYSVGISEGAELTPLETINISLTPRQPLGMTPSALGMSADSKQIYVACSGANAVAVADVSEDRTRVSGFIPTGWYPTAVRGLRDGRLIVVNGKGLRSYANPKGPGPLKSPEPPHLGIRSDQYVGSIQRGTVAFVDPFDSAALANYTKAVRANSPYRDTKLDTPAPAVLSRIKHVIYVVKENRTYDQMLGDMKEGNGDSSLVLFGEKYTPNHHKLAREFVLFDNFYVSADVSADGHNWSTAAIANDYVEKFWPNSYAARRKKYDYEGGEPAALPPAGYLWTNARQRGITMRNYGYFATNRKEAGPDGVQIDSVRDPVLSPITNTHYRAFDLNYSDVDRIKVFQQDLAQFEGKGDMPQFLFMRLGNDHTSGTAPGKIAPLSSLADNDYALGLLVESVSKSRFWADTAIFVLEDDAQNGADHVDSHRSSAFVISPFTHRGIVDSTMYNTTSMLRTMEMILGMRPMTHFDAAAAPMIAAFGNPVATPYTAAPPNVSLTDRNPERSATAARSRLMNFDEEDLNQDDELNDVLWAAIRGPASAPPLPVRSIFR
ncbi:MAG: bifunctional YncE family protein/alkaline phosphatase family protein [Acidobacteriota bacterium]|nr:bifunctional YncE family protein/alkaline phosphatase family protein [Acidobacteriota bacterium]